MKKCLLPAVFCLLFLASSLRAQEIVELPKASPADVGMSAEKLAKVDGLMQDSIDNKRIAGGIVMVARHGKVVHHQAYGLMDLEADKPMQTDTIMRIYSMSKSITSAAIMMLFDEGKLHCNDPVSKYLPELKNAGVVDGDKVVPAKNEMTIADLLRHTAGYSYGGSGNKTHDAAYAKLDMLDTSVDLAAFQKKLGELPLLFEPGTDWKYGISIDVLGRIVEVASGQSFEAFLQERFFDPLDMRDTGFNVPAAKVSRFAANYTSDGKGKLTLRDDPKTSRYLTPPPFQGGGGGLVSTSRDYMRFMMMIAGGGKFQGKQYLTQESVKLMTTNQLPKDVGWIKFGEIREGVGYGFGFNVRVSMSDWDPDGVVGEIGWGGAASTHYWASPDHDLTVITLEQIMPYSFLTEFKLKGVIYDAVEK